MYIWHIHTHHIYNHTYIYIDTLSEHMFCKCNLYDMQMYIYILYIYIYMFAHHCYIFAMMVHVYYVFATICVHTTPACRANQQCLSSSTAWRLNGGLQLCKCACISMNNDGQSVLAQMLTENVCETEDRQLFSPRRDQWQGQYNCNDTLFNIPFW